MRVYCNIYNSTEYIIEMTQLRTDTYGSLYSHEPTNLQKQNCIGNMQDNKSNAIIIYNNNKYDLTKYWSCTELKVS
jgi:hypothetical protein